MEFFDKFFGFAQDTGKLATDNIILPLLAYTPVKDTFLNQLVADKAPAFVGGKVWDKAAGVESVPATLADNVVSAPVPHPKRAERHALEFIVGFGVHSGVSTFLTPYLGLAGARLTGQTAAEVAERSLGHALDSQAVQDFGQDWDAFCVEAVDNRYFW